MVIVAKTVSVRSCSTLNLTAYNLVHVLNLSSINDINIPVISSISRYIDVTGVTVIVAKTMQVRLASEYDYFITIYLRI